MSIKTDWRTGMKNAPFILAVAALAASINTANAFDTHENTALLCASMDDTGMLEEKCKYVPGRPHSVQVRMNTTPGNARTICKEVASMMKGVGAKFDKGMELRIYAPLPSKTRILAKCKLPN